MSDALIPVSPMGLDLLVWFGQWTPELYRLDWDLLKRNPPGFRRVQDVSVYRDGVHEDATAKKQIAPHPKRVHGMCQDLQARHLLEGHIGLYRLTQRGRAVLKFADLECPDAFESHCPEIFDPFDLTPHVLPESDLYDMGSHRTKLPDVKATWRRMIQMYAEGSRHRVNGMQTRTSATLVRPTGNHIHLNGSLREHHQCVEIQICNNAGLEVCSFQCSTEQFTDLLTSNSAVPVTLSHYFGSDGVLRSEPAPPPVNIGNRMKHRVEGANLNTLKRLDKLVETVEGLKMGKKAKAALLFDLRNLRELWPSNTAFAVTQAVEEVSSIVEGVLTMIQEKQDMALEAPQDVAKVLLLGTDVLDIEEG